ncbi:MAG: ATP-binding protein [Clostridium sp.]|jgi:DNA replication protein DnaC|nr:ATP-binding protein [Clostridium sp.]
MTRVDGRDEPDSHKILSNDPSVAGLPDTPPPEICGFCGAERYTEGFAFGDRIFWFPPGAKPCTCEQGQEKHRRETAEDKARAEAERKAEADRKMRERVRRAIGDSGMGERFLQRTFKNYIAETKEQGAIAGVALEYARDFDSKLPKRGQPLPGRNGFLISGTKGTGKTHIAAAIANYLLDKGTAVICMNERDLFGRIRRTFSTSGGMDESAVLETYKRVPLLIIDDLGKERATEWTLATLYAIIDWRYNSAMPLIITTNYDAPKLIERMTPTTQYGERDATTAETIVDRFAEMTESITMRGESWRTR